jgi:GNAT superfamily N-acetyltransferase
VNTTATGDVRQRYVDGVLAAAATSLGAVLRPGTTVVGSQDRAGSTVAVVYPLSQHTVVWCAPEHADRLSGLNCDLVLGAREITRRCEQLGGTHAGGGNHLVLPADAILVSDPTRPLKWVNRHDAEDRSAIASFVEACDAREVDEAEIDLDDLDESIVVGLDRSGAVAALASGRPWEIDHAFDDIGVLTHPDHRRAGWGSTVVAEYVRRRRQQGRLMFYNHDVENRGSARVAAAVGFEPITTVTAISFG